MNISNVIFILIFNMNIGWIFIFTLNYIEFQFEYINIEYIIIYIISIRITIYESGQYQINQRYNTVISLSRSPGTRRSKSYDPTTLKRTAQAEANSNSQLSLCPA